MNVIVCGNETYEPDSLPVRLLPELRKRFAEHVFLHLDPNEEWEGTGDVLLLDTVINAEEPMVFDSLEKFESAPRVSMHDFDALANLRLMEKLGKLKSVRVIGLPPQMDEKEAVDFVAEKLTSGERSPHTYP